MKKLKSNDQPSEGEVMIRQRQPNFAGPQSLPCYKDPNTHKVITFKDAEGTDCALVITGTQIWRSNSTADQAKIKFMLGDKEKGTAGFINSRAWFGFRDALEIVDRIDDAKGRNESREKKLEATVLVKKYISEKKETELGFLFDIFTRFGTTKLHAEVLRDEIYTILEEDPDMVNELLTSPDKDMRLVFKRAVHNGFLTVSDAGQFMFNKTSLGSTIESAMETFRNNADLYEVVKQGSEMDAL